MSDKRDSTDLLHIIGQISELTEKVEAFSGLQILNGYQEVDAGSQRPLVKGNGDKYPIVFEKSFEKEPQVFIGLSYLDANTNEHDLRIVASAEEVTAEGFQLIVKTFRDTRILGYRVNWLAFNSL